MLNSLADEGGNVLQSQVGVLPFSSRLFTMYHNICKVTHVIMAEGQTHVHRIKFSPNQVLNKELDSI